MLSFLPPEITAAGTSILRRRFKLYQYLLLVTLARGGGIVNFPKLPVGSWIP